LVSCVTGPSTATSAAARRPARTRTMTAQPQTAPGTSAPGQQALLSAPMNRSWLARTLEEPLEPEMEIVDAHHHLWADQRRGYDLGDFRLDTDSGHRVVQTVFVDCMTSYRTSGPEHLRPVGETEWVAQ